MRLFITGTGTGVGKTWVTVALTEALRSQGRTVAAVKPVETGCEPDPLDAAALGEACGQPRLAMAEGFYRAEAPLAPYAVALSGGPVPPTVENLARSIRAVETPEVDDLLVEGAGGPLVPLNASSLLVDLVQQIGASAILVGVDELGTLSHTLTAQESLTTRGIDVCAIVLTRREPEISQAPNAPILRQRSGVPVFGVGPWTKPTGNGPKLDRLAAHLLA